MRVQLGAYVAAALIALTHSTPAGAQWFKESRTFTLYEENDALTSTGDESYTQGLRLTWDFSQWPEWARNAEPFGLRRLLSKILRRPYQKAEDPCTPQLDRASHPCGSVSFGLGQVQFTPADIKTMELQPQDRPFAGWLFGSMALNVRDGPLQTSTELMAGVVGPLSHAQSFQSLAHWTWSSGAEQPQGWHHQLRNSVHAGVIANAAYHVLEFCRAGCTGAFEERRWLDVTPRGELIATTAMQRASVGLTVRVGARFPDGAFGNRIPANAPLLPPLKKTWWYAGFLTADARAVGFNGFLEGTYADNASNGWRDRNEIKARNTVNEASGGIGVGNRAGSFTFQIVSRTEEYDPFVNSRVVVRPLGRHIYGALTFSINASQ